MWNDNAVQVAQSQYAQSAVGQLKAPTQARDPRETGNMVARLQVASELTARLRVRLESLADRLHETGRDVPQRGEEQAHMTLLRFPDDIIIDAREAEAQLNRIEGALGI